ncbi:hypothetical protein KM043_011256 [Ampulex compressa]|nr:hypothetical protein KM043_011256 [Ampulex compressa]
MASAIDTVNSVLGLDRVNMNGRFFFIEERHGCNGNFAVNCVISNSIKQNYSLCLVLFHNTFEHYHNVGMRLGYNLYTLRNKGQVTIVEPMKLIASNIDNFCNNGSDLADSVLTESTLETNKNMVRELSEAVKEKCFTAAKYNETVVIIVDDLNHLHDLGLNIRDSMNYVRYLKSLVESQKTLQLCALAHSYGENQHYSDSDTLTNGLKYIAHLFVTVEPLKTGHSKDASGKMTINWRIDSIRRKYHWTESVTYLYKLVDWQVKLYAPGTVPALV